MCLINHQLIKGLVNLLLVVQQEQRGSSSCWAVLAQHPQTQSLFLLSGPPGCIYFAECCSPHFLSAFCRPQAGLPSVPSSRAVRIQVCRCPIQSPILGHQLRFGNCPKEGGSLGHPKSHSVSPAIPTTTSVSLVPRKEVTKSHQV